MSKFFIVVFSLLAVAQLSLGLQGEVQEEGGQGRTWTIGKSLPKGKVNDLYLSDNEEVVIKVPHKGQEKNLKKQFDLINVWKNDLRTSGEISDDAEMQSKMHTFFFLAKGKAEDGTEVYITNNLGTVDLEKWSHENHDLKKVATICSHIIISGHAAIVGKIAKESMTAKDYMIVGDSEGVAIGFQTAEKAIGHKAEAAATWKIVAHSQTLVKTLLTKQGKHHATGKNKAHYAELLKLANDFILEGTPWRMVEWSGKFAEWNVA